MDSIAEKFLDQLSRRLQGQGIRLTFTGELVRDLSARCGTKSGARQMRSLIQSRVEGPLAAYLLRCPEKPARVEAVMAEEGVCFH